MRDMPQSNDESYTEDNDKKVLKMEDTNTRLDAFKSKIPIFRVDIRQTKSIKNYMSPTETGTKISGAARLLPYFPVPNGSDKH
ncbi:hypothetical protein BPAE_0110g00210 [Botrytis paeoniae]|uniref:Uncharacterized protein n=1 Tax=Botrytis paeoniae TaxID=278948 RepID=A0A4Z1FNR2_9HELO|nr:hypothetical protein BPAE_0110g00210 [Botrytis paeoniae]